jgi:NOL1/NOP2/fmu family ribosome biogenesis protein
VVIANEVNRSRIKALSENLERWGSHNSLICNQSLDHLSLWHDSADRVLLDAPCSGEGMFRKSTEALSMWSESTILGCAKRQRGLLSEAGKLVKAGGSLVYSTCTFAPEENEEVVAEFLEKHPEFELQEITLENLSPARSDWLSHTKHDVSKASRIWPHQAQGEGHFIALFKKITGLSRLVKSASFYPVNKQTEQLWRDFCQQTLGQVIFEQPLTLFGDRLYAVNETIPDVKGIQVVKTGLWLGTMLKNRFEPSHSLALALGPEQLNPAMTIDFSATDDPLLRYMQGHPLESSGEKGWVIISVAGFPLGWGKRSGSIVNNAYPKGLRLN